MMDHARNTPLLIYDGDCRFCRQWIERWRGLTTDRVEYAPYQAVAEQFPEVDAGRFSRAVQLVDRDGTFYQGAEAVFRTLAETPGHGTGLWMYRRIPGFAMLSEALYLGVAAHRRLLSGVAALMWGGLFAPSTYVLSRWLTVRCVGFVYLIAFLSLMVQIKGLAGSAGISPAGELLSTLEERGLSFFEVPTLAWWILSDGVLWWGCIVGVVLAAGIIARIMPALCLVLAWVLYLSYATICTPFLNFQWDIFLLEVGFVCIFVESWHWRPNLATERAPSAWSLWMLRLCLLKLMVASGMVKLLADDEVWNNLTALTYHYWTQPIPTVLAWYAHHLPLWVHKASCLVMFIIELAVPFAMFGPRFFRICAGVVLIALQILIALTGNYTFFNLLTAIICLALLDDRLLCRFLPRARARLARRCPITAPGWVRGVTGGRGVFLALLCCTYGVLCASVTWNDWQGMKQRLVRRDADHQYTWLDLPDFAQRWHQWIQQRVIVPMRPFRTVNSYGLFRNMTESRPELVIEGSNDRQTWVAYEFKYKPGDVSRPPPFIAPHQPRLDWQMWFEALRAEPQMNSRRRRPNRWFAYFLRGVVDGSPEVLELLERNPFPDEPPRHVRALLYQYSFTSPEQRAHSGNWWVAEYSGVYYGVSR